MKPATVACRRFDPTRDSRRRPPLSAASEDANHRTPPSWSPCLQYRYTPRLAAGISRQIDRTPHCISGRSAKTGTSSRRLSGGATARVHPGYLLRNAGRNSSQNRWYVRFLSLGSELTWAALTERPQLSGLTATRNRGAGSESPMRHASRTTPKNPKSSAEIELSQLRRNDVLPGTRVRAGRHSWPPGRRRK